MADTSSPGFFETIFWKLVAFVVALLSMLWAIINRDVRRIEMKHDSLRADFDVYKTDAGKGYERLARIEGLIEQAAKDREEMVTHLREDINTIHRRLDDFFGPRKDK